MFHPSNRVTTLTGVGLDITQKLVLERKEISSKYHSKTGSESVKNRVIFFFFKSSFKFPSQ